MACRCDGYESNPGPSMEEKLKHAETVACRAQSLVNKLATILDTLGYHPTSDIQKAIEVERLALIAHKRKELEGEATTLKKQAETVERRIRSIKELGGTVPSEMFEEVSSLKRKASRLFSVPDQDLLK